MPSIQVEHGSPEWLSVRQQTIGSSESACLFGMGFKTQFQLGAEKAGQLEDDFSDDERVLIGAAIEGGIAEAIRAKYSVQLRKVRRYITHATVEGMGASLDYEELTEDAGWVPAELKNVDHWIFSREWAEDEEYGYLPPDKYLIQLQHQLACTGKPYGFIYALVGGNRLERIKIPRSDRLIRAIEAAVSLFWKRQKAGEPHPIDYAADRAAMMRVFLEIDPGRREEDMVGDIELAHLVSRYAEAKRRYDEAENDMEQIKSAIFLKIKEHETVLAAGAKITCKRVEAKPERQVTYKAQPARRELRVYLTKELRDGK